MKSKTREILKNKEFFFELLRDFTIKNILSVLNKKPDDFSLLVGGVVREWVRTSEISKDVDIATNLKYEEVVKRIESNFKELSVYSNKEKLASYGAFSFVLNGYSVTITQFRLDIKSLGRKAITEPTDSIQEDAKRRDFTINALYIDKNANIYDFFNGIEDLQKDLVNFIGDTRQRIREDYLRILRFFRFSCLLKSRYKKHVIEDISKERDGLKEISNNRVTSELSKIILLDNWENAFKIMYKYKILDTIFCDKFSFSEVFLLKCLAEIKKNKDYSQMGYELVLFVLSGNDNQSFNALVNRLSLIKIQKKLIKIISENKFLIKSSRLSIKTKMFVLKNWKNKDLMNLIKIIKPKLSKSLGNFITKIQLNPIRFGDILKGKKINKEMIKIVVEDIEKEWIKSNFKATTKQIDNIISRYER